MDVKTVAPVVVNPDIVSKKASTYEGNVPEITYGRAPTSEPASQAHVTSARPSRREMLLSSWETRRNSARPPGSATRIGTMKLTCAPSRAMATDQNSGKKSSAPMMANTRPRYLRTIRMLTVL